MKSKLFSAALIAATALFTASCSNDDVLVQNPTAAETVSVPALKVNVGEISRAGSISEAGGWTNFWANANDLQKNYDYRVIVQVFAKGQLETPVATVKKAMNVEVGQLAPDNNTISIEGLRLPAGNDYEAVAWVDFTAKGSADNLIYNADNLAEVSMKDYAAGNTYAQGTNAEMKDCYTGRINFTLSADGTITGDGANLNILAKRPLAKVRIIMTDYKTVADWKTYLSGQDVNRILNAAAMKVKDMSTKFNAVSGEPTTGEGDYAFQNDFNLESTGAASTIKWIQTPASLDFKTLEAVSLDETSAVSADKAVFPVLDFNYFIPASNEASAVYDMSFQALAKNKATAPYVWGDGVTAETTENAATPWKVIAQRNINSVPVKKNCLTTIWGNFLTKGYDFTVTVNDEFNNEVNKVVLEDDNTTTSQFNVDGVTVIVNRDAKGNIVSIDVDKDEDKLTADNYVNVMKQVNAIAGNWTADTKINIYPNTYMKDVTDGIITGGKLGDIYIITEDVLAAPYTASGFTNKLYFVSAQAQTAKIDLTSAKRVELNGDGSYTDVKVKTDGNGIINANTNGTVNLDAAKALIESGTHAGTVNLNPAGAGVAYIQDGTFTNDVNVSSSLYLTGGNSEKDINVLKGTKEIDVMSQLNFGHLVVSMESQIGTGEIGLYAPNGTVGSGQYNSTAFKVIDAGTLSAYSE
jgi:hypothetical protein